MIGGGIVAEKKSVCRLRRKVLQDPADVRQEPHVEHPVRFVEDEDLEPLELRVGEAEVVEQTAGRRDEDVDAGAEGVLLRAHADAAEDRRAPGAACGRRARWCARRSARRARAWA